MTAPTMTQIPGFRGDLIAPGDDRYDSARALWNGNVDRRPGLIARCRSTADIAAAVRFARAHDVEIAVRDGGHNVAGTAGCDDGIVIDLSEMCAVSVDPVERTARVQGDALWRDVDRATQAHGLATTGGIVGHTGVAGLTLGGGLGWFMRKHGLTVDNLVEAEVVTATGDVVGHRPTTPTTPSTTTRTSVPAERGPATIDALDGRPRRLGRGRQPRRRELKHNPRR